MTISEYFLQKQPISDEAVDETFYKNTQAITFANTTECYVAIKIAHTGGDTWAFGWEIRDGADAPVAYRDCTPNITTRGDIRKLVYGMTKVLQKKVAAMERPSARLVNLVHHAVVEAGSYYKAHSNGK